jgi:cytochrome P450
MIVGHTLFGTDMERASAAVGEAMDAFMDVFSFVLLPFSDFLEKLPLPQVRRVDEARRRLDEIIYRIIAERRGTLAAGEQGNDLLSLLLRAQDEEGGTGAMSDEQVRDECVTLVLAGHETTANALTWTWYLLSQHPEIEARLHDELDSTLGNRLPAAADVPQLRYAEMIFAEAMRLYPPAWGLARKALEAHTIAGYVIPRGGVILMNQYVTHRDPRWYPDPEKFDPGRWAGENDRPKFVYFPFGGGPRQCIGENFAWMEGVLLLSTLAQRWCMRLDRNQRIGLRPVLTLRPKYGMRMLLQARG